CVATVTKIVFSNLNFKHSNLIVRTLRCTFPIAQRVRFAGKRWEEEHYEDGVKWMFLEHSGPLFAPEYEPLPDGIDFYYDV
ncbi:hypothetical protein chiPu_0024443, partial [Chiloscyllium punctatum]|nr:hypothetical protein [Chiloscyllium punctatum]